jgi:hypothetical protein
VLELSGEKKPTRSAVYPFATASEDRGLPRFPVKTQLALAAMTPATSDSAGAFTALVKDEYSRWGQIAKRANIVPE